MAQEIMLIIDTVICPNCERYIAVSEKVCPCFLAMIKEEPKTKEK